MNIKNIVFDKSILIKILIIVFYICISIFFYLSEKISFELYASYQDTILTIIGILLGISIMITLYYIGKYYDYTKEVIKTKSEYNVYVMKIELLLDRYQKKVTEKLKKYPKKQNEIQKILNELKQSKIDQHPNIHDDIKCISNNISKLIIQETIMVLCFALSVLLIYFAMIHESSLNIFIIVIVGLFSISLLIINGWLIYDNFLKRLINILDGTYGFLTKYKVSFYRINLMMTFIEQK